MHRYSYHVQWSEADDAYIAKSPEFPYLATDGQTPQEAIAELQEVIEASIEILQEKGVPLPEPQVLAATA